MVWAETGILMAAGGLRGVLGYLENVIAKGEFTGFSVGKFFATAIKFAVLGMGFYFGFGTDALTSAGMTVAADFGLTKLEKLVAKK